MNSLFSKTFLWMAIGLLVTFITGYVVSINPTMLENIFGGAGYWIFIILELIIVIFLSARVMKMKPTTAKVSFLLYSFVSGLTFSSIFIAFSMSSIILVFLISALMFGILSLIGYKTKADLTKIGTYLYIGLFVVILVLLLNLFLNSSMLSTIISVVSVILFIGITAHDVQKIKALENMGLPEENLAIYGALELYLDFINIFIDLLQLFGSDN